MGKMRNYGSFVELGLENSGQLICNCLRMAFPCPLQPYSSTGYNGEKGQTILRRPTLRAKSGELGEQAPAIFSQVCANSWTKRRFNADLRQILGIFMLNMTHSQMLGKFKYTLPAKF